MERAAYYRHVGIAILSGVRARSPTDREYIAGAPKSSWSPPLQRHWLPSRADGQPDPILPDVEFVVAVAVMDEHERIGSRFGNRNA